MTLAELIEQPPIPISEFFAQCTEGQLREKIAEEDRRFIRGAGDVDLMTMSINVDAAQWARYTALCRALRAKSMPDGKRSEKPPQG